jgi:uncharacterized protein (TIGR03032 family)
MTATAAPSPVTFTYSQGFREVLEQLGISLAVSTYQAGKLCLLSSDGHKIHLTSRTYEKAMGLYVHERGLLLGTRTQVWSFMNVPALAKRYFPEQDYDALYIPQMSYVTGDISVHDVVLLDGQVVAVNTQFSCLSLMSPEYSFIPLWKPPFIRTLIAEDRCHLNGLALENGKPRYICALGETDQAGGWRDNRAAGGCVIDMYTNQVMCRGLAMPHSLRVYDNALWVLSSGTGEMGIITNGGWEPLVYLPGFLRGLAFAGPLAFVGLSKIREKKVFGGLPIEEKIKELQCGIQIVNIRTGAVLGTLEFTGGVEELYDIQILPFRRPQLMGLQKDDLTHMYHLPANNAMLKR